MENAPKAEGDGAERGDLPYRKWLRDKWKFFSDVLGHRLAVALLTLAGAILIVLVVGAIGLMVGLIWYLAPIFVANPKLSITDRKDLVQGFASVAQAAAVGLTGAVGFIGLAFTWRNLRMTHESSRKTLELTEQAQITERFTKAIEQLGEEDDNKGPRIEIRIGGIYALERIAKYYLQSQSSREEYGPIIELLTAYVRENAKRDLGEVRRPTLQSDQVVKFAEGRFYASGARGDIQTVLDVLGRCHDKSMAEEHGVSLDLRETDLSGANLIGVNFSGADLSRANLSGATLYGAKLSGVELSGADLSGSVLSGADFSGAILYEAHLQGALLGPVTVSGLEFQRVSRLQGVWKKTSEGEPYIKEANLGAARWLKSRQIELAIGSTDVELPRDLEPPEMWQTEVIQQVKRIASRMKDEEEMRPERDA